MENFYSVYYLQNMATFPFTGVAIISHTLKYKFQNNKVSIMLMISVL